MIVLLDQSLPTALTVSILTLMSRPCGMRKNGGAGAGRTGRPSVTAGWVMFSLIIYIENRMYRTPRNPRN